MNRREFLTGASAMAAMSGLETWAASASRDGLIWSFMPQFGMAMWGDIRHLPKRDHIMSKQLTDEEFAVINHLEYHSIKKINFDEAYWKTLASRLRRDGCNQLLVDLGEFVIYPSHPELAVQGSWSADRMLNEVRRLKAMGFDVVPKINFSTCHDIWLGPYARMVSTPKYYQVTADLIRDTYEMFDRPKFIHLGLDEEDIYEYQSKTTSLVRIRSNDLWWHDVTYFFGQVEKLGARPWMWSDYLRRHELKDFLSRMPKSVMQSPWTYSTEKPSFDDPKIKIFLTLAENGYDVMPCGSNCYGYKDNFPSMAEFCRKNLPAEHFKGMLFSPWVPTRSPYERLLNEASGLMAEAIRRAK